MGFTESIWEEVGGESFEFINQDGKKESISVNEMRAYIIELSKKDDPYSLDLRIHTKLYIYKGIINDYLKEYGDKYFPPYKNCVFRISYDVLKGNEIFSLNCIYENYIWGATANELESVYMDFKNKINDGTLNW